MPIISKFALFMQFSLKIWNIKQQALDTQTPLDGKMSAPLNETFLCNVSSLHEHSSVFHGLLFTKVLPSNCPLFVILKFLLVGWSKETGKNNLWYNLHPIQPSPYLKFINIYGMPQWWNSGQLYRSKQNINHVRPHLCSADISF